MKMLNCIRCNNSIPDDSSFCPFCGSKIDNSCTKTCIEASTEIPMPSDPTNIDVVLKRAFIFIEDGLYDRADKYLEIVLDQDPECAEAYLGKLMIELGVKTREDLENYKDLFDYSNNYKRALKYGNQNLKVFLSNCIRSINECNKQEHAQYANNSYCRALEIMNTAKSEAEYNEAVALFESARGVENSEILLNECIKLAKKAEAREQAEKAMNAAKGPIGYRKAAKLFESIEDDEDSKQLAQKCFYLADQAEKEEKRKTRITLAIVFAVLAFYAFLMFLIIYNFG